MRHKNRAAAATAEWIATLLVITLVGGCPGRSPEARDRTSEPLGIARGVVTPDTLRQHVSVLSSDAMEGRSPGTAGALQTRRHLADEMAGLGLEPAFNGSWEQPFELIGISTQAPEHWSFAATDGGLTLDYWDEYVATSGVQRATASIADAGVVFVGYGIEAPEFDWDDFKGADLDGKVLLMLNNDPDWSDDLFGGETRLYYGRWRYKYESAARQGAVGAIIIHTTPSAGYPWQVVQPTGPDFQLPAGDEPKLEIEAWITEDSASRLAALAGFELESLVEAAKSRDFEPVDLGLTTSLVLTNTLDSVEGANVGGLLTGSDPTLAEQLVVYTAHFDHLGVGEPDADGDRIYNGARDNAAGSAAVLAIAEAFAALPTPPARSLLFLFVDAEEQGLLGSQYFASHPIVPAGRLAANLNIDGANIWGRTRDLGIVGFGKSDLDRVVERVAARQGRVVKPEQSPDKGYFYRSDQFNFARIGVPAIYLDEGVDFIDQPEGWGAQQIEAWTEIHYHRPSDELVDSWRFDGFVEDTLLMFEAGLIIANRPELPSWNPGDEFEAARRAALAALD